jgi:hypothetical protein
VIDRLQTVLYWAAAAAAGGMTAWMVTAVAMWLSRQF